MNTTPTSTTEFLDLPDGRLAYDDTGMGPSCYATSSSQRACTWTPLITALPPKVALQALSAVTAAYTVSGRSRGCLVFMKCR